MAGSRLLSKALPPAPDNTQHSTLEVDYDRGLEKDGKAAPIVGQNSKDEKVIGYNNEKIVSYSNGKIISYDDVGKQVVIVDTFDVQSDSSRPLEERTILGTRRKRFIILLLLLLVLIILGAVGGGVGGTIAVHRREQKATVPMNNSLPTTRVRYANTGLAAMQPKGSTFAMSIVSYRSGKHLMLYTVDDGKNLQQHEYTISDTDLVPTSVVSLTSESATGLTVEPHSPLAVVAQDNRPLYMTDTLPECTQDTPLANLILFTIPDCNSLILNAWDCSTGNRRSHVRD